MCQKRQILFNGVLTQFMLETHVYTYKLPISAWETIWKIVHKNYILERHLEPYCISWENVDLSKLHFNLIKMKAEICFFWKFEKYILCLG